MLKSVFSRLALKASRVLPGFNQNDFGIFSSKFIWYLDDCTIITFGLV